MRRRGNESVACVPLPHDTAKVAGKSLVKEHGLCRAGACATPCAGTPQAAALQSQNATTLRTTRASVLCAAGTVLLLLASFPSQAADTKPSGTGTVQSSRLYTPPDPAAGGGVKGRIARGDQPARAVFAMAVDDYRLVYKGEMAGDGREFAFRGLPVGRYDLVVLFDDAFAEGLTLTRDENSLAAADLASIESAVRKGTPFFDTKAIHRCEGTGGEAGKARGVLQEVRTRPVTLQSAAVRTDIQVRSLKLVLAENVGSPGWSVSNTREIVRQEVGPREPRGLLNHLYDARLGGIRVLGAVKDIGELSIKR